MRRRSIRPLPECVQNSVRSGVVLFDLTRVVEELVFNSIDASSTKVSVAVDVGTCYVKVVDNGSGITRDGLVLLGERYATSKFDQLADMDIATGSFGFRGEALGSISDVSLLEIVTKALGRPNGYRKVMKGSKCLHLGIDGDKQDVGTTVIVRDLFYNQPVRRRHLQSSPKKVLHSIKESVLRIALVHLDITFKVVDTESEEELLCTFPSPSPLPLLMSGFGIEVSSSLKELDVSDRILKVSGYISGPSETFSVKDLQYIYVNSRFTCKGPIHKLLNQLAATFNSSDLLTANIGPHNGKRRSQTYPAYILNLSCPRSHYDLTFEPSKTSVEFKDWDFVLTFIEKAIRHLWSRTISNDSFTCGADMSEKDDMWKEDDNTISVEEDFGIARKRCRTKCYQSYLDFPSPQLKIQPEVSKFLSTCENDRFLCRESSKNALEIKENQIEMGFACHTENSFQPCDKSLGQERVNEENISHLGSPYVNVSSEDCFLETKLTTKRSNDDMDRTLDPRWGNPALKVEANMSSGLDCFDIGNVVEEASKEVKKSFMRSCSSRRSLQPDGAPSDSDISFEYNFDGFKTKKEWLDHDYTAELEKIVDKNQNIKQWQYETENFWFPPNLTTRHNKIMGSEFLPIDSVSADCFPEESEDPLSSVPQIKKVGSNHRASISDWSPLIPNHLLKAKPQDHLKFRHEDVLDGHLKYDISTKYDRYADREVKDSVSSIDNVQNSSSQSLKGDIFDLPGNEFNDVLFPKCSDAFSVETEWFSKDSCEKDLPSHAISSLSCVDKDGDHRIRDTYQEKMHGCENKPSRSHSAPPFYRGRKRFISLNNCSIMEAGKLHFNANKVVPVLKEIKNLKHRKQSSPCEYRLLSKPSSLNESLHCSRQNVKTTPDTSEIQNLKMHTEGQDLHNYKTNTEGFISMEAEDPLAPGLKWWDSCAQTANEDKSHNRPSQDTSILDISSGILLLAGDSLVPKSISKNFLESAKVLQQVDRKFIPVVAGGTLAIIDQHAADERIRLEELRKKVLSGEMKTITYLDAEQELVLPEIGHQLLHNYAEQIQNWGWICSIYSQNSRSFKRDLNLLHSQPSVVTLLGVPCILGVDLTDADLLEFLQQLADTDGSSVIPPSVLRVLNFKACRGAIMFGDKLLPSECSLIVEELKRTSLCFQCAHGRPTTVPLVNIEMLHKQIANLGLWNDDKNELWHGLHRHELSLDRAVRRFSSAGGRR